MATALVVAGNSFLGAELLRQLVATGYAVVATSRHGTPCGSHATWHACDLTDAAPIAALVAHVQPDLIVNCAGATATSDPRTLFDLHVTGTHNLLSAARQSTPNAPLVLFGSAAEYGPVPASQLPITEAQPLHPTSFFGASKAAQSQLALAAAATWNLRIALLRPFNIIGPGLPQHYLASALIGRLRKHTAGPFAVANGTATRDFIDVRDVAGAVLSIASQAPLTPSQCAQYNVCSNQEVTVLDVARHLARHVPELKVTDAGAADSRSNLQRSLGSSARLQQATSWRPTISWQQSLDDLWSASTA
jgi:GDP-4-dehydro-6-deoxy-D-mannose reductase